VACPRLRTRARWESAATQFSCRRRLNCGAVVSQRDPPPAAPRAPLASDGGRLAVELFEGSKGGRTLDLAVWTRYCRGRFAMSLYWRATILAPLASATVAFAGVDLAFGRFSGMRLDRVADCKTSAPIGARARLRKGGRPRGTLDRSSAGQPVRLMRAGSSISMRQRRMGEAAFLAPVSGPLGESSP